MEQVRIVKEMREHDKRNGRTSEFVRPRYMVWENVPGAFSSGNPKGADFQAVLEEIVKIVRWEIPSIPIPKNGWPNAGCISGVGDSGVPFSIAWRLHDAQFWGATQYIDGRMWIPGTPQRRKRIALVADFNGLSAPEILFERQSLHGHFESGGEERQRTAGSASDGIGKASGVVTKGNGDAFLSPEMHTSLSTGGGEAGQGYPAVLTHEPVLLESNQNHATVQTDGISTALPASAGMGGGYVPMVAGFKPRNSSDARSVGFEEEKSATVSTTANEAIVYGISPYDSNAMKSDNPHSGIYEADTSRTLDLNGGSPACNQGGMVVLEGNGSRESHRGDGYKESDTMYTLNTTEVHAVALENHPADSRIKIS